MRQRAGLREGHPGTALDRPGWDEVSRSQITVCFPPACPGWRVSSICRASPSAGCPQFVRVVYGRYIQHGASERMVVSPGHEANAILHLPGGQSGHSLSPHYRDQYHDWLEGRELPLAGKPVKGSPDL